MKGQHPSNVVVGIEQPEKIGNFSSSSYVELAFLKNKQTIDNDTLINKCAPFHSFFSLD